jgi:hypothetical protein
MLSNLLLLPISVTHAVLLRNTAQVSCEWFNHWCPECSPETLCLDTENCDGCLPVELQTGTNPHDLITCDELELTLPYDFLALDPQSPPDDYECNGGLID